MYGLPLTRATSPDGRWAYTLYEAASEHRRSSTRSTPSAGPRSASTSTLADQRGYRGSACSRASTGRASRDRSRRTGRLVDSRLRGQRARPPAPPADADGGGRRGRRSAGVALLLVAARWSASASSTRGARRGELARLVATGQERDPARPEVERDRDGRASGPLIVLALAGWRCRPSASRTSAASPRPRVVGSPGGARARCRATPPGAASGDRDDRPLERREADPSDRAEQRPAARGTQRGRRPPGLRSAASTATSARGSKRCEVPARLPGARRSTSTRSPTSTPTASPSAPGSTAAAST